MIEDRSMEVICRINAAACWGVRERIFTISDSAWIGNELCQLSFAALACLRVPITIFMIWRFQ